MSNISEYLFRAREKAERKFNSFNKYIKNEDRVSVDLPELKNMPLVSVILYTEDDYSSSLEALKNQTNYRNLEIIAVSDRDIECNASAVIVEYGCDKNTAYKVGLEIAKGEYVGFMDSSTILSDTAIYYMMRQLIYDDFDLVYSDEDKLVNDNRTEPFFKPDWSPHTLRSFNYVGFALIRKSLIADFKDYYSLLIDLSRNNIKAAHVERLLVHKTSTEREICPAPVYKGNQKVSIIIPSKDNFECLKRCIDSIRNKSSYKNYEIIVVDNGSSEETKNRVQKIADKYIYKKQDFNFSYMCNTGAEKADGDFLLFLNDDTEVITEGWLEGMLAFASDQLAGAVGCKLLYPKSNIIQHCGVINIKNGPVHCFIGQKDKELYFNINNIPCNFSAVTAACLMIDKNKFTGFDINMPVAYNDVDLCFSLIEKGCYNVSVNTVKLYHYESMSRGDDRKDVNKLKRLYTERKHLYEKHKAFYFRDSLYNFNLTQHRADFSPELPKYVFKGGFSKVVTDPERFICNDIKYEIEYVHCGDMIRVGGFAFIDNLPDIIYILVMTRNDIAVPVRAYRELRKDISDEIGLCGFSANIDSNLFEKGSYPLGIMLVRGLKKHIVITDKKINIKL